MSISRRRFFQQGAAGALAGVAAPLHSAERLFTGRPSSLPEVQTAGQIRLDHNENVYGPSKRAVQVMQESIALTNRYPDSEYNNLLETIAALHKVKPEQIIPGCGSSEILRMVAATFLGSHKKLILASPTFDLLADEARKLNAETLVVPLTKAYAHDLNTMLARAGDSSGLIYICNPNNPTGTLTPRQDLDSFLQKLPQSLHVVIDEAYHQYVPASPNHVSFLDRPVDDNRVIVTRTLSAIYGLAGLRIGYAVTSARTARKLSAARLPSSVNVIAARVAVAALQDSEFVNSCAQQTADDRQEFLNMANARMLRVIDSSANFVMLKMDLNAQDVIDHFRKNNILLGPPVPSMPAYIRLSLGTLAEMKEFWRVLDLLPPHEHKMQM